MVQASCFRVKIIMANWAIRLAGGKSVSTLAGDYGDGGTQLLSVARFKCAFLRHLSLLVLRISYHIYEKVPLRSTLNDAVGAIRNDI